MRIISLVKETWLSKTCLSTFNIFLIRFSEYNILWHDNQCWFIDVSQSVEPNHPHGLEFLYRDCVNITNFFNKKGIKNCQTAQSLFTYVTGLSLKDDENDDAQNEAEILARVRNFERSQEILSLR